MRWKRAEARAAKLLGGDGCRRTPLSGSLAHFRDTETKNDTDHPTLFIEVKQRLKHGVWNWYRKAKDESEREAKRAKKPRKTPVIVLDEVRAPGAIVCVHTNDLEEFCKNFLASKSTGRKKSV